MLEIIGLCAIFATGAVVCFAGGALWFGGAMFSDNKTAWVGTAVFAIGGALLWLCFHLSPFSVSIVRTQ